MRSRIGRARAMRLSTVAGALLAAIVHAPVAARTVEDEQVWLAATILGDPRGDRGFAWFVDVQPRFQEGGDRFRQLILRGGAGWKLSPRVTLYAGYAHVALPRLGPDRNEDRPFVQANWIVARPGDATLSSRTRLERRDFSNGREAGWRGRELLRYVDPIGSPERTRALVSGEVYWNFNDTDYGARAGFDQVRAFAGIEVPIGRRNTIELGYLNQYVNDPGGDWRMNHIASIGLFIRR